MSEFEPNKINREGELNRVEKAEQTIVERLNGHDIGSIPMNVFTDIADLEDSVAFERGTESVIQETIRIDSNRNKAYLIEKIQMDKAISNYRLAVEDESKNARINRDIVNDTERMRIYVKRKLAINLQELKSRELEKRI